MQLGMSALCQKRTSSVLFDHLVGAGEKRVRYSKAKRFRGLEVDDQIEFCRLLYLSRVTFPLPRHTKKLGLEDRASPLGKGERRERLMSE